MPRLSMPGPPTPEHERVGQVVGCAFMAVLTIGAGERLWTFFCARYPYFPRWTAIFLGGVLLLACGYRLRRHLATGLGRATGMVGHWLRGIVGQLLLRRRMAIAERRVLAKRDRESRWLPQHSGESWRNQRRELRDASDIATVQRWEQRQTTDLEETVAAANDDEAREGPSRREAARANVWRFFVEHSSQLARRCSRAAVQLFLRRQMHDGLASRVVAQNGLAFIAALQRQLSVNKVLRAWRELQSHLRNSPLDLDFIRHFCRERLRSRRPPEEIDREADELVAHLHRVAVPQGYQEQLLPVAEALWQSIAREVDAQFSGWKLTLTAEERDHEIRRRYELRKSQH